MKIRIKKAGLMTTVQDLGRTQYLSQGVPLSGAMDRLSAQISNLTIGNKVGDAVIEFTQGGAAFEVLEDALIAYSGDGAVFRTGGLTLPSDKPFFVPAGTDIFLETGRDGSRTCLAVAGGWDVPEVLGSRSTYLPAKMGGLGGRRLKENDELISAANLSETTANIFEALKEKGINFPGWGAARTALLPPDRKTVRVAKGNEFAWFEDGSARNFFSNPYTLSKNSDRMGYQLTGEPLKRAVTAEMLSTAVAPGTIQVTNDGRLVLLMADCQTTGGYPRIAQVAAADLPLCAQLKPGDTINFREISWKEAEKLYIQQQSDLEKIAAAIKFRYTK